MYRATPVTYLVSSLISTGISGIPITCATDELLHITPPPSLTCAQYLSSYLLTSGGNLLNPESMFDCQFCPVEDTDALLASVGVFYDQRWRDFGISLVYSAVNIGLALGLYWIARVPKNRKSG